MRRLAMAVVVLAACKKGGPPEADLDYARRVGEDARVTLEQAVAEAKLHAPAHDPTRGFAACTDLLPLLGRLHASEHAALAVTLEQLCFHDLPIAELGALAAAGSCTGPTFQTARTALVEHGRDDAEAKQLFAEYSTRCPQ